MERGPAPAAAAGTEETTAAAGPSARNPGAAVSHGVMSGAAWGTSSAPAAGPTWDSVSEADPPARAGGLWQPLQQPRGQGAKCRGGGGPGASMARGKESSAAGGACPLPRLVWDMPSGVGMGTGAASPKWGPPRWGRQAPSRDRSSRGPLREPRAGARAIDSLK